jgi:t-SNARE complex subunit (syntaxin)
MTRRREHIVFCALNPTLNLSRLHEESDSTTLRQAQILQSQLSPHELAYQESLIQEREAEIREIETGMHELAEIFRDLGTLVGEQGQMIGP